MELKNDFTWQIPFTLAVECSDAFSDDPFYVNLDQVIYLYLKFKS